VGFGCWEEYDGKNGRDKERSSENEFQVVFYQYKVSLMVKK
jgi:hypothetical protein